VAPQSTLFFKDPESDEDWKVIKEITEEAPCANIEKYERQLKAALEKIQLGGALLSKGANETNPFSKLITTISFGSYYSVSAKNRTKQFEYFMA